MSKFRIVLFLDDTVPAQSTLLGQIQNTLASIASNLAPLDANGAPIDNIEVRKVA
jgi:hypothetical protein